MKKLFVSNLFLILNLFIFVNFTYALSPLPKNSYLRFGDNMRQVKILQEILNSNSLTKVTEEGAGSPGQENWYFGKLTENAVKKFQEKYGLEVTGKIDFKTWKKINEYVQGGGEVQTNTDTNNSTLQEKINNADEKRKSLNEQNKKDFEEAKKLKAEKDKENKELAEASKKGFFENLMEKTTSFFSSKNTPPVSDNPYLNNNNASPTNVSTNPNQNQSQNPSIFNQPFGAGSPFATQQPQQQPNLLNRLMQGLTQPNVQPRPQQTPRNINDLLDQSTQWAPCEPMKGQGEGVLVGGGQGGGCGRGSYFGHRLDGTYDSQDNGLGCYKGEGGRYNTRTEEGIALPVWLQQQMFGSSGPGASATPGCGGWVEVTNPDNGKCIKFRIVDSGPQTGTGRIIDFTGTACNRIGCVTDRKYCFRKAADQSVVNNDKN